MDLELIDIEQRLLFLKLLQPETDEVIRGDGQDDGGEEGKIGNLILPSQPITVFVV